MKKLVPLITPLVIAAFLGMTCRQVSAGGAPVATNVAVFCVTSGQKVQMVNIDLSTATTNAVTGQLEIYQTVEIDTDGDRIENIYAYDTNAVASINTKGNKGLFLTETYDAAGATNVVPATVSYKNLGITEDPNYTYTNTGYAFKSGPTQNVVAQPVKGCIMWVIGILVLVIGAIIVYLLIKTCKKCLGDNNENNNT